MKAAAALLLGILVAVSGAAAFATATEPEIALKDAPGRALTQGLCAVCHSLEYIPANAPAMDRGAWQKSVQKMRERYGAPIDDAQAREIVDYLAATYAGKR